MYAEIILIGNELLIGKIQDTNGIFMIRKLLEYGIQVSRITIIPDDVDVISNEIISALKRHPLFIFTSGGLGPTYDDMTFEGIAKAFNVPLVLNKEALKYLKERYDKLKKMGRTQFSEINESRLKMVKIPSNAKPLKNNAGAAPGILIEIKHKKGTTKLIAMPGFPDEMKAIFEDHVISFLKEVKSYYYHAGIKFLGIGESQIAEDLIRFRKQFPEIWIKTHPIKENTPIVRNEIHLTTFFDEDNEIKKEEIKKRMHELLELCKATIKKYNGKILEIY
ncbi:MAG: competence/damage-inducible protein A [Promethearchaeota archaeon]